MIFLVFLGYILEYAQGMTGYRSFDYGDLNANLWGIAIAFYLCLRSPGKLIFHIDKKMCRRVISS